MRTMNITDTKAHFSAVINQVLLGEEFIIERMGIPVAKITPYKPENRPNILGLMEGQADVPDDFDNWPDEEAKFLGIID